MQLSDTLNAPRDGGEPDWSWSVSALAALSAIVFVSAVVAAILIAHANAITALGIDTPRGLVWLSIAIASGAGGVFCGTVIVACLADAEIVARQAMIDHLKPFELAYRAASSVEERNRMAARASAEATRLVSRTLDWVADLGELTLTAEAAAEQRQQRYVDRMEAIVQKAALGVDAAEELARCSFDYMQREWQARRRT